LEKEEKEKKTLGFSCVCGVFCFKRPRGEEKKGKKNHGRFQSYSIKAPLSRPEKDVRGKKKEKRGEGEYNSGDFSRTRGTQGEKKGMVPCFSEIT